ncbi:tripartite tricarboxylate transporter substrate binding protein [Roseomonas sp. AR75]|uniref:Bug family tripartite tricarboxylate transporter substrate binding protein n=1 Tax=Roseomonas sp. AR75 TaxID=2562311 RepID=UPI0010C0A4A7|nr:tripartite tricarboxylate transporter substrate binding protein [Roseomonas sp. AR75]
MITRRSLGGLAALPLLAGSRMAAAQEAYPTRDLLGLIQWGAGGATDVTARAVTPHVEQALGAKIVLQNRPGGSGAIAMTAVHTAPADGYTLLYAAENPLLYGVLNLSRIDLVNEFYAVNVLARGVPVIVVNADKPWRTLKDLVADMRANPGRIRMAGTGPGGQPHVVSSMLSSLGNIRHISIPFDGEGPGLTALQGGHADFMPAGSGAAAQHVRAGRLRALAVWNTEPLPSFPGVPPATADFPELARFMPWGSFYGVWVRRSVPEDRRAKLVAAFKAGASNPQFVELMQGNGNVVMNISGDEADNFLKRWQSVTTWTLQEAGAARTSPAELGIPRP